MALVAACSSGNVVGSATRQPVGGDSVGPALAPTATAPPEPTREPTPQPTVTPPHDRGFVAPAPDAPVGEAQEALVLGQRFRLEAARTDQELARGLMDRTELADDAAMLFVFEQQIMAAFWMKNTLIPLDILFLDDNGVVVDVQTMVPEPGVVDSDLRRYRSAGPARYALEMNAGLAEALGIAPGVQVLFR